jgi:predicted nucleotidyltransferase
MNIHFNEIELFNNLHSLSVFKSEVGSYLYGLKNKSSDIDFLSIYIEPNLNLYTFLWEHHQLQYKTNSIDYNFTTLTSFIRNILTGDSTINFEMLFSDNLKNSELNFLYENRQYFINYNIIKSYLGLAKRDLKYWKKDTNNCLKHSIETNKKLSHFVRGVLFAEMLLNNKFTLKLNKSFILNYEKSDLDILIDIKNSDFQVDLDFINFIEEKMYDLRKLLNHKFEQGYIYKYMNPIKMKEIDSFIKDFISSKQNEINISHIDYHNLFYESLENGIKY